MAIKPIIVTLFSLTMFAQTQAESLHIAVTASFKPVIDELVLRFEQSTSHDVTISSASTGTLFQQSRHGAPFDIFLSADHARPLELKSLLDLPDNSVFIYAMGTLVLVSTDSTIRSLEDLSHLEQPIILANAKVAPFGVAAEQVLSAVNYNGQRVLANNVMQAQQYLNLGLSPVGIVSASVALELPNIPIDISLYDPVVQAGIVLKPTPASLMFVEFLASTEVSELYDKYGYSMPTSTF